MGLPSWKIGVSTVLFCTFCLCCGGGKSALCCTVLLSCDSVGLPDGVTSWRHLPRPAFIRHSLRCAVPSFMSPVPRSHCHVSSSQLPTASRPSPVAAAFICSLSLSQRLALLQRRPFCRGFPPATVALPGVNHWRRILSLFIDTHDWHTRRPLGSYPSNINVPLTLHSIPAPSATLYLCVLLTPCIGGRGKVLCSPSGSGPEPGVS